MLRRDFKLFCRCLTASLVLLVITALIASLAAISAAESGSYQKLTVAVSDSEDSTVSRLLVHTVRSTDAVSTLFDTVTMREDKAKQALGNGEIAAAVVLPSDFTDAVLSGTPASGQIYLTSALSAQKDLIEAFARGGELLILSGQAGVFAGERLLMRSDADSDTIDTWLNNTNATLLDEAVRSSALYFETEKLGYSDTGMDEIACGALVWLASFLILSGVTWIPLFTTDAEPALLLRMRALGVTWEKVLFWKLLLTFLARLLVTLIPMIVLDSLGIVRAEPRAAGWLLLGVLVSTLVSACLSMCFGNGTAALAVVAGVGLFALGGVTARQLLPGAVRLFGNLSPVGSVFSLLMPAFGGNSPGMIAVLTALFWGLLSLFLLRLRLVRLMRGKGDA